MAIKEVCAREGGSLTDYEVLVLVREARAAAQVNHPNVMACHDHHVEAKMSPTHTLRGGGSSLTRIARPALTVHHTANILNHGTCVYILRPNPAARLRPYSD